MRRALAKFAKTSETQSATRKSSDIPPVTPEEHASMTELMGEIATSANGWPFTSPKAKPVGEWTREAIMAMLESAENYGLWEYKHGTQGKKFRAVAADLRERHGIIRSVDTIRRVYRDLIEHAKALMMQDAEKIRDIMLNDEVMSVAIKHVKMYENDKLVHEVCPFLLAFA